MIILVSLIGKLKTKGRRWLTDIRKCVIKSGIRNSSQVTLCLTSSGEQVEGKGKLLCCDCVIKKTSGHSGGQSCRKQILRF